MFASTVVTGDAHGALLSEDKPLPVQTPYGRAKQEGERMVLGSGLPAVVIRPSHVYGPGGWYAQELLPRLRQPGRFAVIGSGATCGTSSTSTTSRRRCVLAAERDRGRLDLPRRRRRADHASTTSWRCTAPELGVGPPRRIPAPLARVVAGGNAVDAVVRSARSSNAQIKRELGWRSVATPEPHGSASPLAVAGLA